MCSAILTDHPDREIARASIDKLLIIKDDEAYCQPCVSPVWDTALACHALMESASEQAEQQAVKGLAWLLPLQVLDLAGDWADAATERLRPGGWAFQYANAYYPDLDDTAVVVMALDRAKAGVPDRYSTADRAGAGMDPRTAKRERRLGRLRRRQHALFPRQHSIRRSRRSA